MIAYHGTNYRGVITRLIPADRVDSTGMCWATIDPEYAAQYGSRILKVDIRIKKLFDPKNDEICKEIFNSFIEENGAISEYDSPEEGYSNDGYPLWENNDSLAKLAKEHGYDAIISSEGDGKIGIGFFSESATII